MKEEILKTQAEEFEEFACLQQALRLRSESKSPREQFAELMAQHEKRMEEVNFLCKFIKLVVEAKLAERKGA